MPEQYHHGVRVIEINDGTQGTLLKILQGLVKCYPKTYCTNAYASLR